MSDMVPPGEGKTRLVIISEDDLSEIRRLIGRMYLWVDDENETNKQDCTDVAKMFLGLLERMSDEAPLIHAPDVVVEKESGYVSARSHLYRFPLRNSYVAQLVLPYEFSEEDFNRLSAFLRALVLPGKRSER
jgi:hypothetical protein